MGGWNSHSAYAERFSLKHSLYLNLDTSNCRYNSFCPHLAAGHLPPLCPLSSCPPLHLPRVPALRHLLHLSPSAPQAACLPHGSHQPSPIPTSFLQQPYACTAPTPRGPLGSTAAQALGNKTATAAAINPFAGFLPCYHVETAAPPASSGVTAGTPCMPNWVCVSRTEVTWCRRSSPRGTADCHQTRPWWKKPNIWKDMPWLELKHRKPREESTWCAVIAVMQKTRVDRGLHLWCSVLQAILQSKSSPCRNASWLNKLIYARSNMDSLSQVPLEDPLSKDIPKDSWTKSRRGRWSSPGVDDHHPCSILKFLQIYVSNRSEGNLPSACISSFAFKSASAMLLLLLPYCSFCVLVLSKALAFYYAVCYIANIIFSVPTQSFSSFKLTLCISFSKDTIFQFMLLLSLW